MPEGGAFVEASADAVRIRVKVVPGASRDALAGVLGDRLKIRVAAPPEGGRANDAVAALLADALLVPIASITLVNGASNPRKTFAARGVTLSDALERLRERTS